MLTVSTVAAQACQFDHFALARIRPTIYCCTSICDRLGSNQELKLIVNGLCHIGDLSSAVIPSPDGSPPACNLSAISRPTIEHLDAHRPSVNLILVVQTLPQVTLKVHDNRVVGIRV